MVFFSAKQPVRLAFSVFDTVVSFLVYCTGVWGCAVTIANALETLISNFRPACKYGYAL